MLVVFLPPGVHRNARPLEIQTPGHRRENLLKKFQSWPKLILSFFTPHSSPTNLTCKLLRVIFNLSKVLISRPTNWDGGALGREPSVRRRSLRLGPRSGPSSRDLAPPPRPPPGEVKLPNGSRFPKQKGKKYFSLTFCPRLRLKPT